MKKLLCLVLALGLVLSFAGCKKEEAEPSKPQTVAKDAEIEKIVESGKFEDAQYGLGADFDEVNDYYEKLFEEYMDTHYGVNAGDGHEDEIHMDGGHDHGDVAYYELIEGENYIELETEKFRFYFETVAEEKKVVAIATDADVFGFTANVTTKQEIQNKVGSDNKTLNATDEDLEFVGIRQGDTLILRYEYEKNVLDFYFFENTLQTTVIRAK